MSLPWSAVFSKVKFKVRKSERSNFGRGYYNIQAVVHGTAFSYFEHVTLAVTKVLLQYTWLGDVFEISVSTIQLKQCHQTT
jgi:hypothetical protein